eukprot:228936-Hanusia_phi.AAC.1
MERVRVSVAERTRGEQSMSLSPAPPAAPPLVRTSLLFLASSSLPDALLFSWCTSLLLMHFSSPDALLFS